MHPFTCCLVFISEFKIKIMKKGIIYSAFILLAAMTSCYYMGPCVDGTGNIVEENRDVDDFYSVSNTTSFDVYVTQSDTFSVSVNAQANILPLIETYESGGTLLIKTREFTCIRSAYDVEIFVTLPEIEELNLTGSGTLVCESIVGDIVELSLTSSGRMYVDSVFCYEMYIKNTGSGTFESELIATEFAELRITGSGQLKFGDMYADQVSVQHSSSGTIRGGIIDTYETELSLTGSGNIVVYGGTDDLVTSHTASGRIDALDLFATDVRAAASGSGNTYVNVSGILDVTILGSGDVVYTGSPVSIDSRIVGCGDLRIYQAKDSYFRLPLSRIHLSPCFP